MKWAKMIARKAPRVHLEKAVLRAANLRLSMLRWRTRSLHEQVKRRREKELYGRKGVFACI